MNHKIQINSIEFKWPGRPLKTHDDIVFLSADPSSIKWPFHRHLRIINGISKFVAAIKLVYKYIEMLDFSWRWRSSCLCFFVLVFRFSFVAFFWVNIKFWPFLFVAVLGLRKPARAALTGFSRTCEAINFNTSCSKNRTVGNFLFFLVRRKCWFGKKINYMY